MKYLGTNLNQGDEGLTNENHRPPGKEIKVINKWKSFPSLWIGGLDMLQRPVSPTAIHRFNAVPVKIQSLVCKKRKAHPKMYMELQWTQTAKTILKKNKTGGIAFPDFKTYSRVSTAVWCGHTDTETHRTEQRDQK